MNTVEKINLFAPVILATLIAVASAVQAGNTEMKHVREQAVQHMSDFAKLVQPTAENIVNRASGFAPEVVYQANVLDLPKRVNNHRKYTSDFVAFSIRSGKAATDILCLKAANKVYWCQVRPNIEAAKSRPLRGYRKNDLTKLVILAMYNRYEVEPLNSSKLEELAPKLANDLKSVSLKPNTDVNVRDLIRLQAAYVYSLNSYKNPLQIFLFEPSVDIQPFLAVKKIRGERRFYRDSYKTILNML